MERLSYGGGGGGGAVGGENFGYENGVVMTRDPKPRLRWTADLHDRFVDAVTKLGGPDRSSYVQFSNHSPGTITNSPSADNDQRQIPVADALNTHLEVRRTLQEQLEVQKKLQMRVEAQGRYLQAILEKAQKSLSFDINCEGNVEETRAELTNFNLALSSLMENVNGGADRKPNVVQMNDVPKKATSCSAFQNYAVGERERNKDVKLKVEGESINFDLNTKDSFEFVAVNGNELQSHMFSYKR
ncbi:hypothetical protein QUC31_009205 [Theobroma cacao]